MSRLEHGENVLTPPRRQSMWRLYLEKYQDPMIRILLVAAVVSLVLSFVKNDYIETIGIIAAVILATTVGFYFERDAARKFDVLTQLGEEQRVKVIRSLTPNPSPTGEGNYKGEGNNYKVVRVTFEDEATVPFDLSNGKMDADILSDNDQLFQDLWRTYFKAICIKERMNPKKQLSDMPRRYWKYMTEKNEKI